MNFLTGYLAKHFHGQFPMWQAFLNGLVGYLGLITLSYLAHPYAPYPTMLVVTWAGLLFLWRGMWFSGQGAKKQGRRFSGLAFQVLVGIFALQAAVNTVRAILGLDTL